MAITRCLLTNFYADFGGGEFALLAYAKHLVAAGREIHVCLFRRGPLAEALENAGCFVHVVRQRLDCGPRGAIFTGVWFVPRLVRLLRRVKPDYVMSWTLHEMPFVIRAAQMTGIPAAFRDQGRPAATASEADWKRKRLAKLIRGGQTVVFPTTRGQAEFLGRLGVPQEKIHHVYLGVDSGHYHPAGACRERVLTELGISAGTPVVGIFGRLIALKGHSVLMNAVRRLERDDVHVLVVGGTQLNEVKGREYLDKLIRLTQDLGIANRVHFTQFRSDVRDLMSACDVVCSASEWETFGLTLVEAMMCGKPVVATDVSGPREIVVSGVTGYLYPVGDSETLGRHLGHLLADPDLARRMGQAGRQRALELFEVNRNLQQLDDAIQRLVSGPCRDLGARK